MASTSPKKRPNFPLKLLAAYQTDFACINVISAAACLAKPDIPNFSFRWCVKAIGQQMRQVRALRLGQAKYGLFDGRWVHCPMLSMNPCGLNVGERRGTPIGSLDTMVAAHAISQHAMLITNNTREFAKVTGLQLDNWAPSRLIAK